jgi:transposase
VSKEDVIEQLEAENADLKHENAQLKRLIFGAKSEKYKPALIDVNQLNMFADMEEEQHLAEPSTTAVKGYTKSKKAHPGRQPLPDHLPVEEVVLEPEEDTSGLKKIGEDVLEVLDYTPASILKRRYIRPKYAKADGEGILQAPPPVRPLPKSIAEAGLLANIAVSKFVEHTPFYRQIQKFTRDYALPIPSSTLNDWFAATCTLLDPLYNKLKDKVLDTDYLQVDESPIKVLDNDKKGKTHQGYMWVYHNPLSRLVLFNYRKGRGQHGPKEILAHYSGILQCDGYTVYDKIGKREEITLAGCLVHVRRKYVEAKEQDAERSTYALDIFSQIYVNEKLAKKNRDRQAYRKQHTLPLLHELKEWIDQESIKVLPKSSIGKAMRYTISQWPKLLSIFTDGRIELDNNLIENKIRPLALGRKNYLFAGSHKGAERIAMMYSLFASCKANNINPFDWLKQTLEQIPHCKISALEKLLPNHFEGVVGRMLTL